MLGTWFHSLVCGVYSYVRQLNVFTHSMRYTLLTWVSKNFLIFANYCRFHERIEPFTNKGRLIVFSVLGLYEHPYFIKLCLALAILYMQLKR